MCPQIVGREGGPGGSPIRPGILSNSPIGALVPITGFDRCFNEHYSVEAYLPEALPVDVSFDRTTWMAINEATKALGRLDAAASIVPNPQLLARVAMRREAVGTSALEGTYANLADVFAAEVVPEEDRASDLPPNVREVMNYVLAADLAYQ